jgi:ElaA protein
VTVDPDIHDAAFADVPASVLYALLKLRVDVFVVEQACAYPDLDGRDLEPATRHLWVADGEEPVAYARVLADADAARIGRVVTRASHRGRGLAERLVRHAVASIAGPIVLDAQSYLVDWYTALGFVRDGEEYLDDGIAHVPMRHTLRRLPGGDSLRSDNR